MSSSASIIRFQDVTKTVTRHKGQRLLREHLAELFQRREPRGFDALKRVSFEVERGESLAVVGHNGAGKSTLLSLVAGLSQPDSGVISVHGRIAALLELGSGFHGDLSGRENVSLNASLLGLSRKKTEACFQSIVDFAGIGDFIDEPLRTYSSGMIMRLAFAVAVNVDPDILLIDEVLAVGDATFQVKCYDRLREFRRAGKTLLAVSHGNAILRELCDRAIWLDQGQLIMTGPIDDVLERYDGSHRAVSIV